MEQPIETEPLEDLGDQIDRAYEARRYEPTQISVRVPLDQPIANVARVLADLGLVLRAGPHGLYVMPADQVAS